jgi:CBS domain-containing protein
MVFFSEAYLSALLRYGVHDREGRLFGQLSDVLVRSHTRFPVVTGIAVRPRGSKDILHFPWTAVRTASAEGMRIASSPDAATRYEPHPDEIHLRRDVLDKQIVDVSGKRVVRVHDLKLGAVAGRVLLTHADVGIRGILRRVGGEHFTLTLCRALHIHLPERLIAWEHLRMPAAGGNLEADATREALRRIHPADLADVAEDLSASERAAFLQSMDEDVAADAMEAMEAVPLVAAVSQLPDRQASDLIDEMEPDEGADLLGELPQERADALLDLMAPDQAADLRRLLSYPEDSAGGLMTPEHVAVPAGVTAAEALAMVRERARDVESIYYVYVVDGEGRLKGTLSLRGLIMEDPGEVVDSLMTRDAASVTLDTQQTDIARLVARYNLLAIPVVDEEGRLQGIVTADDAIDAVIPTSWKKRIPKAFGR